MLGELDIYLRLSFTTVETIGAGGPFDVAQCQCGEGQCSQCIYVVLLVWDLLFYGVFSMGSC